MVYLGFQNPCPFHDEGDIDKCRTSIFKYVKGNLSSFHGYALDIALPHSEAEREGHREIPPEAHALASTRHFLTLGG